MSQHIAAVFKMEIPQIPLGVFSAISWWDKRKNYFILWKVLWGCNWFTIRYGCSKISIAAQGRPYPKKFGTTALKEQRHLKEGFVETTSSTSLQRLPSVAQTKQILD